MLSPVLTYKEIKFFFDKFKDGDANDITYRMALIDKFVNRVDVFDGEDSRLEIYCNAMGQKMISSLGKLMSSPKEQLAPQVGLEPTTLRLTAACSGIRYDRLRQVLVQAQHENSIEEVHF